MRFNFRNSKFTFQADKQFGNYGFSTLFLFSATQRLEGMTSLIPDGSNEHIILADVEICSLEQAEKEAKYIQNKWSLSDIIIRSDKEGSYRFWCWKRVDFKTYLKILLDIPHLDMIFFDYTVRRGKATLRTIKKKNRPQEKTVSILGSYFVPIPEQCEQAIYDTGLAKKGIEISLGDIS